MKLKKLELENVSSFRDKEEVHFNDGLNIFIGPNGGGKSNLLEIITTILNSHFVSPWNLSEADDRLNAAISQENLNKILKVNDESGSPNKSAVLTFLVTKEDIFNIEVIKKNLDLLTEYQKRIFRIDSIKSQFAFIFNDLPNLKAYENRELVYRALPRLFRRANETDFPTSHEDELVYALFETYLSFYELISYLIEVVNSEKNEKLYLFRSIFHCVSFKRDIAAPSLTITPDAIGYMNSKNKLKVNGIRGESGLLEYAINFLCAKYILLSTDAFEKDETVASIKRNLKHLKCDFHFEKIDKFKNKCKFILERSGKEVDLTKSSPGEKSFISLLFFLFCMDLSNGILVIDEPELHLHPKWQKILSNVFGQIAEKGQNQILFATHAPIFVSEKNISAVQRVFKNDGTTKVRRKETQDREEQKIVQILNAVNSEGVFFADKVLLVEGIVDKVIYEKILRAFQKSSDNYEVIDLLIVDGKENFKKFRNYLNQWEIRNFIIADSDYVSEDGADTFILKNGKIEDYFGGGHFNTAQAIMISSKIHGLENVDGELKDIFLEILK